MPSALAYKARASISQGGAAPLTVIVRCGEHGLASSVRLHHRAWLAIESQAKEMTRKDLAIQQCT
jgi:hypothetical protein